ncbi:MAG: hypothetical protein GY839_04600 [candidate division Zixibacteria bacterium]|nr:hypothetical protein [candidate division Zixibacteria bacterium]
MRKLFIILMMVALIFCFTHMSAIADWEPGDGHKMHFPQLPDEEGWDVNATWPKVLADDWRCSQTGFVKAIHFWGSWRFEMEGPIESFSISIHADIPADPPEIPYSRPDDPPLWQQVIDWNMVTAIMLTPPFVEGWYNPGTGEVDATDHNIYYQYNIELPEFMWFFQEEETIYWLNISANLENPDLRWGWKSSLNHWNDNAVFSDDVYDWLLMFEPSMGPTFPYMPGDVNGDIYVDDRDVDFLTDYFQGGPPPPYVIPNTIPPFYAAADANGDCIVIGTDVIYLIDYLIHGGPPPTFCPDYPPMEVMQQLDLAFVINGGGNLYEYLPGDVNMYNGIWPPLVIGGDVTYLVNYFRANPASQSCLLDGFWCSADANGDCMVIGSDVTRLVNYFRGLAAITYCPDCDPAWLTPDDLPEEEPLGWPNCDN